MSRRGGVLYPVDKNANPPKPPAAATRTSPPLSLADRMNAEAKALRDIRDRAFADIKRTLERLGQEDADPSFYDDPSYVELLEEAEYKESIASALRSQAERIEALEGALRKLGQASWLVLADAVETDDTYAENIIEAAGNISPNLGELAFCWHIAAALSPDEAPARVKE